MNPRSREKINLFIRTKYPMILLVIIGAAAYANSFTGPFIFDDTSAIEDNRYIRHLWPLGDAMSAPYQSSVAGRPIASLTLALNYAVSGYSVWSYHLFNLIIHILAALTLYGIVRQTLLNDRLRQRFGNHAAPIAFAAAAIWMVHPVQTESVTYIIQRTESLMGLFYLLTLYTAIRAIQSPRPVILSTLSVACCALGMATKEVMVTAPLIVLLYDKMFGAGSFASALRRRWAFYISLAATWVILFILMSVGPRSNTVGFDIKTGPLGYALTQFGVIVHYLRLCLWPAGLCLDYHLPVAKTWIQIVPPMLVISAFIAVTLWSLARNRTWSYPLAWFFAILAPTSSIVPIADLAFEHRLYLPLAGFVVLFVMAGYVMLDKIPDSLRFFGQALKHRLPTVLVIVLVVVLSSLTLNRNQDYRSAESIWRSVTAVAPHNPRAHNNLGLALQSQGELVEAIKCYRQALQVSPDYVDALNNIGIVLNIQGNLDSAIDHFHKALQIKPDYAEAYSNLGLVYKSQGKTQQATRYFYLALQLKPDDPDINNNLGAALLTQGKYDEAIKFFQQALLLKPDHAETHNNLGYALMSLGSFNEALGSFNKALQIQPDYFSPMTGLAWALATHPEPQMRDANQAVALAGRAAELTGYQNPKVLNTLAAAYAAANQPEQAVKYYYQALQLDPYIKPSRALETLLKQKIPK